MGMCSNDGCCDNRRGFWDQAFWIVVIITIIVFWVNYFSGGNYFSFNNG